MSQNSLPADDIRSLWKNIRIMCLAMIVMSSAFLLVALVICEVSGPVRPGINEYKKWLLPALAVITFLVFLFARARLQRGILQLREDGGTLSQKLLAYRVVMVKYFAAIEWVVILGTILFLSTADFSYLVFSAIIIGFMAANLPRKNRVTDLLQLDSVQSAELNQ
ncbi:MAG: hypothetical protein NVV59_02100 [Chitinophagaceae bacterium]|nr:hypothetical protein [Chitinophagaceae bacterium]